MGKLTFPKRSLMLTIGGVVLLVLGVTLGLSISAMAMTAEEKPQHMHTLYDVEAQVVTPNPAPPPTPTPTPKPTPANQVKVNIVYPIDGASYPFTDPGSGPLSSAYFTSSFSVTCSGGARRVRWGFDSSPALGGSGFYDQTSVQFVTKLPGGSHVFWVQSDCGENKVNFSIGG